MSASKRKATSLPARSCFTTSTAKAVTSRSPATSFQQFRARGSADRMVMESRTKMQVDKATYTNCDVGDDDWFMRVDRLELDRQRDVGVARNATVVFKGVPMLYSPYLDFSLSGTSQDRIAAADHRQHRAERLRGHAAVLLEHRAQSRRHHRAARSCQARRAAEHGSALSRTELERRSARRIPSG